MRYWIDFDRPATAEIRRIASEQLSAAADLLERRPKGPHEAIHDARKHIKRTRALYRLVRTGPAAFVRHENRRLRTIAGNLAHLRDTAALAESARYLQGQVQNEEIGKAIAELTRHLDQATTRLAHDETDMQQVLTDAAEDLSQAITALKDLHLSEKKRKVAGCLADGWKNTTSKANDALQQCATANAGASGSLYHELRKQAQDRWRQAGLLKQIWPVAMNIIRQQSRTLVDLLGHEHDLTILAEKLASDDTLVIDADRRVELQHAIEAQRQALQYASRQVAKPLFAEKPKRDAAVIEDLIRNR